MNAGVRDGASDADRLLHLEAFLGEVDAWAETLELLGREWAGPQGEVLEAYGAQMRERVRRMTAPRA